MTIPEARTLAAADDSQRDRTRFGEMQLLAKRRFEACYREESAWCGQCHCTIDRKIDGFPTGLGLRDDVMRRNPKRFPAPNIEKKIDTFS